MHWIAPSEKDAANDTLEKRLWGAADQLRANSGLTAQQYSAPVLGLIFLRFAEVRFTKRRAALEKESASSRRGSRVDEPTAYHAEGVIYLAETARFDSLLKLPEGADVGKAINEAMADIEKHNLQLAGVLPRTFQVFSSTLLKELLKKVSEIPAASTTTPSDASTNTFSASSPARKVRKAASSTRPPRSSGSSSRILSPSTGAFSIPRAARAACSSRPRASWPGTRKTQPPNSPSTATRKSARPHGSAG